MSAVLRMVAILIGVLSTVGCDRQAQNLEGDGRSRNRAAGRTNEEAAARQDVPAFRGAEPSEASRGEDGHLKMESFPFVHRHEFVARGCGEDGRCDDLMAWSAKGIYELLVDGETKARSVRVNSILRYSANVFYQGEFLPSFDSHITTLDEHGVLGREFPQQEKDYFAPAFPVLKFVAFYLPWRNVGEIEDGPTKGLVRIDSQEWYEPPFTAWWAYRVWRVDGLVKVAGPYTATSRDGHFRFSGHLERLVEESTGELVESTGDALLSIEPARVLFHRGGPRAMDKYESAQLHSSFRIARYGSKWAEGLEVPPEIRDEYEWLE